MAKYAKLRDGSWGLRVPGRPSAGSTVEVETKSGKVKVETVGRVLWTGNDKYNGGGQMSLCSIAVSRASDYRDDDGGCHTDGNCSSMCDPRSCPCGDGSWFDCC